MGRKGDLVSVKPSLQTVTFPGPTPVQKPKYKFLILYCDLDVLATIIFFAILKPL